MDTNIIEQRVYDIQKDALEFLINLWQEINEDCEELTNYHKNLDLENLLDVGRYFRTYDDTITRYNDYISLIECTIRSKDIGCWIESVYKLMTGKTNYIIFFEELDDKGKPKKGTSYKKYFKNLRRK